MSDLCSRTILMCKLNQLENEKAALQAENNNLKKMIETFASNIPEIQAEAAKAAIYALFEVGNCPQYENGAGDGFIECGDALKFAEEYSEELRKGRAA